MDIVDKATLWAAAQPRTEGAALVLELIEYIQQLQNTVTLKQAAWRPALSAYEQKVINWYAAVPGAERPEGARLALCGLLERLK